MGLTGTDKPNDDDDDDGGIVSDDSGIEVCAFDNRGMGRSSVPTHKSEYTWANFITEELKILCFVFLISVLTISCEIGFVSFFTQFGFCFGTEQR